MPGDLSVQAVNVGRPEKASGEWQHRRRYATGSRDSGVLPAQSLADSTGPPCRSAPLAEVLPTGQRRGEPRRRRRGGGDDEPGMWAPPVASR